MARSEDQYHGSGLLNIFAKIFAALPLGGRPTSIFGRKTAALRPRLKQSDQGLMFNHLVGCDELANGWRVKTANDDDNKAGKNWPTFPHVLRC